MLLSEFTFQSLGEVSRLLARTPKLFIRPDSVPIGEPEEHARRFSAVLSAKVSEDIQFANKLCTQLFILFSLKSGRP